MRLLWFVRFCLAWSGQCVSCECVWLSLSALHRYYECANTGVCTLKVSAADWWVNRPRQRRNEDGYRRAFEMIWNGASTFSSHFDLMRIFSFGKLVRFSSIFFFQLFINVHLSRWPGYVCACVSVECVWLRVLDQWNAITKAKQNASMCRNAQCALHTFIMILVVTRLAAGQPMPIARAHANEREMARRRRRTATFSCTCNLCTCDCYHSKRMKWNENRQRSIHTRPAKYRAKMDFIRKHVAHRTPTKR